MLRRRSYLQEGLFDVWADGNGAPRIPRADMVELVPAAVRGDEDLFETFSEVCLSDGAYANLYKDLFMRE